MRLLNIFERHTKPVACRPCRDVTRRGHAAVRGHVTRPGGGQLPSTGFSPAHLLIAGLLLGGGLTMLVGARSRVAALAL